MACNVQGSPGICTFVPAGARRARRAPARHRPRPPAGSTAPATAPATAASTSRERCASPARVRTQPSSASTSATAQGRCKPGPATICAPFSCDPATSACIVDVPVERRLRQPASLRERKLRAQAARRRCAARTATAPPGSAPTGSAATSRCQRRVRQLQPAGPRSEPAGRVDAGSRDPHGMCRDQGPASLRHRRAPATASAAARSTRPETICVAPSCSGDRLNTAGTCNGLGTCRPPGVQACAPFRCTRRRVHRPLHQRRRLRRRPGLPERQLRPEAQRPAVRRGRRVRQQLLRRRRLLRRGLRAARVAAARCRRRWAAARRWPPATPIPATCCVDQGAATCGTDGKCDGAVGCRKLPAGNRLRARDLRQQRLHAARRRAARPARASRPTPSLRAVRLQRQQVLRRVHGRRAMRRPDNVCSDNSCGLKPNGAFCADRRECSVG